MSSKCGVCSEEIIPIQTPVDYQCDYSLEDTIDKTYYVNLQDYIVPVGSGNIGSLDIVSSDQYASNIIEYVNTNSVKVLADGVYDIRVKIVTEDDTVDVTDKRLGYEVTRDGVILFNSNELLCPSNSGRGEVDLTSKGELKEGDIIRFYYDGRNTSSVGDKYDSMESYIVINRLEDYINKENK